MGKKRKKEKIKMNCRNIIHIYFNLFYFFSNKSKIIIIFRFGFSTKLFFLLTNFISFFHKSNQSIGLECEINRNECLISFFKNFIFFLIKKKIFIFIFIFFEILV